MRTKPTTTPGPAGNDTRAFLLKRLSPEEMERFEERLLLDDDLVTETEAAEAELLDAFVRGTLCPDESAKVAELFRSRPERVAFAKALTHRAEAQPRRASQWTLPLAASLILMTGAALLLTQRAPAPAHPRMPADATRALPAHVQAPTVAAAPATELSRPKKIATFTIALAATRDGQGVPRLELTRETAAVALHIRINPADRFPNYAIDVTTSSGGPVWNGRTTRSTSSAELVVEIPASSLPDGESRIVVAGLGADGSREELGDQAVAIRRR